MTPTLPLFHRIAGQPVIVAGSGEALEARRRLVEKAGGRVVGVKDDTARLAFLVGDDLGALVCDLRARGVLVNVADQPELCDFIVPAVIDRMPVQVAIGTGGASAGLAKALRLRLEVLLPATLGDLAQALFDARPRLRARWPDIADRRRALDAALGEGSVLDPLREGSVDGLAKLLDGTSTDSTFAAIEIRLMSDDPEDLTLRAARLLGQADVIAHEIDVPVAILSRARADAARLEIARGQMLPDRSGLVVILRR